MRVFIDSVLKKDLKKYVSNKDLITAIDRANKGLIDAEYGGNVITQRVGPRKGYRAIIAFTTQTRAFFVYAFAKQDLSDISEKEQNAFKLLAKQLLALTDEEIDISLNTGTWGYEELEYAIKKDNERNSA